MVHPDNGREFRNELPSKEKKKRKLKGIQLSEQSQCEKLLYIYTYSMIPPQIFGKAKTMEAVKRSVFVRD